MLSVMGFVYSSCQSNNGDATYYDGNGALGTCEKPLSSGDYGALSHNCFELTQCNTCAMVQGPKGQVLVTILDKCPGCNSGDLDLSSGAFAKIADIGVGRVHVNWTIVDCNGGVPTVESAGKAGDPKSSGKGNIIANQQVEQIDLEREDEKAKGELSSESVISSAARFVISDLLSILLINALM
eukprot:NODE_277_length_11973_cov_0.221895.p5 type:complete len:183 gc:universal NODE_277_length_11973_cov_0.221895:2668-2120(-)